MKITLNIGGHKKTFFREMTARACRDAYELKREILAELTAEEGQTNYSRETMDKITAFIAAAFGNQFTEDELLDGYEGWFFELIKMVYAMIDNLKDTLDEGFPKNPEAPTEKPKS